MSRGGGIAPRGTPLDRGLVGFVAGIAFLAFLAGTAASVFNVFPFPLLRDAYQGARALWTQYQTSRSPFTALWFAEWTDKAGVVRHDPQRSFDGFTLVSSRDSAGAVLMDMDGQTVHRWSVPFATIHDETARYEGGCAEDYVFWDNVQAFPNGDLMAVLICPERTPWGLGLMRVDRDSRVLWKFLGRAHHEFDIAPDGQIFVLTHEIADQVPAGLDSKIKAPLLTDYIAVLESDGRLQRELPVIDAFARSKYAGVVHPTWNADLLHVNGVRFVTAEIAARFGFLKPGQLLLSFATLNALGAMDLSTNRITWFARAHWIGQHDPDLLENGHILLFDNYGAFAWTGRSRVLEIDPETLGIVWSYDGEGLDRFFSRTMSSQQRLPNGNTLITSSEEGRLIEITANGSPVWEWVAPARAEWNGRKLPGVRSGVRYSRADLAFLATATGREEESPKAP